MGRRLGRMSGRSRLSFTHKRCQELRLGRAYKLFPGMNLLFSSETKTLDSRFDAW